MHFPFESEEKPALVCPARRDQLPPRASHDSPLWRSCEETASGDTWQLLPRRQKPGLLTDRDAAARLSRRGKKKHPAVMGFDETPQKWSWMSESGGCRLVQLWGSVTFALQTVGMQTWRQWGCRNICLETSMQQKALIAVSIKQNIRQRFKLRSF